MIYIKQITLIAHLKIDKYSFSQSQIDIWVPSSMTFRTEFIFPAAINACSSLKSYNLLTSSCLGSPQLYFLAELKTSLLLMLALFWL
jgi:hypothetical protein